MKDSADVMAISAILALSGALAIASLVTFTNVWIASVTVLALPLVTLGMTIVIAKALERRRGKLPQPSHELKEKESGERVEPGREFTQAWLGKSNYGS
ncbi:MAG: hypothetical protein HYX92_04320 [Chloroflexi bacterium]|nr:hypothetical protein [Chloroflexota bacterium]